MSLGTNLKMAVPFASLQAAIFLTLGIYLPFWPLWLDSRGLTATEIAVLLASSAWLRSLATPIFGYAADRWRYGAYLPHLLATGAFCIFGLFYFLHGFWALLAAQLLAICLFHPLVPISDSRSMQAVQTYGLDYGRIRLWGSLTFILASSAGGWLVARSSPDSILLLLMLGLGLSGVAACWLPSTRGETRSPDTAALRRLMANRSFLGFILVAALLQSSHAVYYGFGSIYWRSIDFDEVTIGALWALGVIAEVVFFAFGAFFLKRLGIRGLLILAGGAGLLRWSLIPLALSPEVAGVLQCLHALTYAAAHLGAMHFIAEHTPISCATSAQTVYAAFTGGLAMGGMLFLAGPLYSELQGHAYLIMSLLSTLGGIAAIALPASNDHKEAL